METLAKADVYGGGPAGLASSIAFRLEGFSVHFFESAVPPIDKACGEGLMPDSLRVLRELGVSIPANAGELAVGLHWGTKGVRVVREGLRVHGELIRPKLVVGADGINSLVRRYAGLDGTWREARRYGFRRHYRVAPWSPYMEVHWGSRSQVYITPVSETEVCVAMMARDPRLRLEQELADFPEFRSRLSSARPCSSEIGAVSVSRTLRRVWSGQLVLIGDASGSVDARSTSNLCRTVLRKPIAVPFGKSATTEDRSSAKRTPWYGNPAFAGMLTPSSLKARRLSGMRPSPQALSIGGTADSKR
jgi:2-polyprenyl-6-methoxyphenol hydroxylase-like FAD-dependent oxidoreductase